MPTQQRITEEQLRKFAPSASPNIIPTVVKWFNEFADQYCVNSPQRIAAFFAQLIHESGSFKYVREIASGEAYEGRKDLGNVYPGDGKRYKGRGYIQITGRSNYAALSKDIFQDSKILLDTPDLLATPKYAMLSAFWYWDKRALNDLADKAWLQTITKKINGGLNGWADRLKHYNRICDVLNLPHWKP